MTERVLWNGGIVVLGGLLAACATQQSVLRDRVSEDLACPPAGVEITETGENTFDVAACGEQASYECTPPDDPDGIVCTRQQAAPATAGGEEPAEDAADEAWADTAPPPTGDAEGGGETDPPDDGDATEEPADATDAVEDGAEDGAASEEAAAEAETEEDGAAGQGRPGPAAVENAVRGAVDDKSGVILECVGRDHVVVSVAYRRNGALRVSLRGELRNTPEERCVAAALRGVRVNTRRTQGVVLHPVDR